MIAIEQHLLALDRCSGTLELLQKCRDIVLDNKFQLATYDRETEKRNWTANILIMRNRRYFTDRIERYEHLAAWLEIRYTQYVAYLNGLMETHIIQSLPQPQNLN